jgi:hypothetical protein
VILFSVTDMSVFFDISGIAFRAVHNKILSLNIVISKVLRKTVIQTYLFVKYEYYDSITCVALPFFRLTSAKNIKKKIIREPRIGGPVI